MYAYCVFSPQSHCIGAQFLIEVSIRRKYFSLKRNKSSVCLSVWKKKQILSYYSMGLEVVGGTISYMRLALKLENTQTFRTSTIIIYIYL